MKYFISMIFILLFSVFAYADDSVGSIKKITGSVTVLRGQASIQADAGMKLLQGDVIKTAADSSAGIIFKDSTIFSLGSNTEIIVSRYVFEPKDEKYDFNMNMKKGTAVYESGRMSKLSPQSIKIHTPKATIGVRGTKFLVQVED